MKMYFQAFSICTGEDTIIGNLRLSSFQHISVDEVAKEKLESFSYSREIYVLTPEKVKRRIWLVPSVIGSVALLALCSLYIFIQRKLREKGENEAEQEILQCELGARTTHSSRSRKRKKFTVSRKKGSVLQFFSFESISTATSNFAATCKLGEGGFGPVYKAIHLPDQGERNQFFSQIQDSRCEEL